MASWAVWSAEGLTPKSGMGDISFFENPTEELLATLNPEVILVGLNISKPMQRLSAISIQTITEAQDYKVAARSLRNWMVGSIGIIQIKYPKGTFPASTTMLAFQKN